MARTSRKIEARERARQARVRLDADRARRDEQIEEAAASFFTSTDAEAELRAKLEAITAEQDDAIRALLDLGETQKRVSDLLEITPARVREARSTPPAGEAAGNGGDDSVPGGSQASDAPSTVDSHE